LCVWTGSLELKSHFLKSMKANNLEQLKSIMIDDLETAFADAEDDIKRAIAKMAEDKEEDKPLVFSCALSGKFNVDANTVETSFGFSVKTTIKNKTVLDNPAQTRMEFDEV